MLFLYDWFSLRYSELRAAEKPILVERQTGQYLEKPMNASRAESEVGPIPASGALHNRRKKRNA
ncbi:MAG: hypothetical protein ABI167_00440 [Nitrosospira sp.]